MSAEPTHSRPSSRSEEVFLNTLDAGMRVKVRLLNSERNFLYWSRGQDQHAEGDTVGTVVEPASRLQVALRMGH